MAIKYRLFQEQRATSKFKGLWYARAVTDDEINLEEISKEIEENTTAKQGDVYVVLKELINVMRRHLRNGDVIAIDGFGRFKIGLETKPAPTEKEFTPGKHIVGARLNFQPETHWNATDKTRKKEFLQGLEVKQLSKKEEAKKKKPKS